MREWEPLLKQQLLEPYVNDEQTKTVVASVFIGVGIMILAAIMGIAMFYAYQRSSYYLFSLFAALLFLYSIKMLVLIIVIREKLKLLIFRLYIGSTVFVAVLTLFMTIFFFVQARKGAPPVSYSNQIYRQESLQDSADS